VSGSFHNFTLICSASLVVLTAGLAADSNLNALLRNSPFGSSASGPNDKGNTPLEFRGVMVEGDTYYFSVFAAADSRSEWLSLNENSAKKYVIKSYDPTKQVLTVDNQGQLLTLPLIAGKGGASVGNTALPQAAPRPAVANPTTPQTVTPPNDAERLNKIAEEIKRRRALRQQAISGK